VLLVTMVGMLMTHAMVSVPYNNYINYYEVTLIVGDILSSAPRCQHRVDRDIFWFGESCRLSMNLLSKTFTDILDYIRGRVYV
jgi:hypothetical protein